ncbi:MAG: response regulator [Dysgonamonadaceae bacterium]|nr:response regulator [Dysgonamonadaceae bacterium]
MVETKDQRLFIGTALGIYIYRLNSNTFEIFSKATKNGIQIQSRINSLALDNQNKLWIATNEQGFFVYDFDTDELLQLDNTSDLPSNQVHRVFIDSKQNVWVACEGIYKYLPSSNQLKKLTPNKKNGQEIIVSKFYEDKSNNIWIGTENYGLLKFDRERESFSSYFDKEPMFLYYIHDITEFSPNVLAIGSNSGMTLFNTITGKQELIQASKERGRLSDNAIYCFCQDREGAFWIGTFFSGVNYLSSVNKKIELYTHQDNANSVSGSDISRFYEDESGDIWIATEDAGLNFFDITNKKFASFLSTYNIQAILIENDEMWLGTYGVGIIVFDRRRHKIKKKWNILKDSNVSGLLVKSIIKDSNDRIWVGSNEGFFAYNPVTDSFDLIPGTEKVFIWDIIEDKDRNLWFVSSGKGAFKYTVETKKLINYQYDRENETSISDNFILTLCKDNNHQIWLGTEESGFCKYNYETDDFHRYEQLPNFSNQLIYSIVADNYNHIWFSTSKGLFRFNPDNNQIKVFTVEDGLQSNQFNFNSGFKSSTGKLYFGGVNGFNSFFPEDLTENKFIPPVHITGFHVFNQDIKLDETKKITLNYKQNVFNIEFVSLSYVNPRKNQYAYKLDGFDKDWNFTEEYKVTYTNLSPGKYIFRIKGSNNDGIWNEKGDSIELEIKPPFWKTKIAFFIYMLAVIGILFYVHRRYVLRAQKKQKYALEKAKTEKELELYNSKMSFFTNIAHEIRTPLSLIKAPLEKILKNKQIENDEIIEDLQIIERNTEQLHTLITQLLDFRKIENGLMKPNFINANISELIENVVINFKATAKQKGISIQMDLKESFYAQVDKDALTKILMNLLSNAVKFTKNQIKISLHTHERDKNHFQIRVKDNGLGIPENEKDNIFLPFNQLTTEHENNGFGGVGIGLSYSLSLSDLHSGSLKVENNENEGAVFILTLPVNQQKMDDGLVPETVKENEPVKAEDPEENRPFALLIIEDNTDLRNFLSRNFKNEYKIYTATNGKEALELLKTIIPDIIITDLMMPVMDGIALTREIKNNIHLSHIPVIMLTAKNTVESRIEGYTTGADSYIEKPFSIDLLKTRITNLFENREKIRANFIRSPYSQSISIANNKMDEEFIARMKKIIMQHIQEEDFSVDELASHLCMSRSGLFAKIKGISGLSPLDYIRIERLKRAAELLIENKYPMAEIAMKVGYSTPSYFAKAFQKQFGVLPKDFMKKQ